MQRIAFAAVMSAVLGLAGFARAADTFKVDAVHSTVVFRIKHANIGYVWGRFGAYSGSFTLDDSDPTKNSFAAEVQAGSVSTNNEQRDGHIKSPDFFNAKQYPTMTFKSTAVKKGEGNMLSVTGDMTFHGVTKPVTANIEITGKGEFPKGKARAGIEATFIVKMSDFEVKGAPGMLSDEVKIIVAFEGAKE